MADFVTKKTSILFTGTSEVRCKYDQKHFFFLFSLRSGRRHFFWSSASDEYKWFCVRTLLKRHQSDQKVIIFNNFWYFPPSKQMYVLVVVVVVVIVFIHFHFCQPNSRAHGLACVSFRSENFFSDNSLLF